MKNINEKNVIKDNLIYIGVILLFVIIIPIIVFFIIENNIQSKASNDGWLSFLGGYLGGISTLIAVFITVKQTRDIQDENKDIQARVVKNETEIILRNLRTVVEVSSITSGYKLEKIYLEQLKGNKLIITPQYRYIIGLIDNKSELSEKQKKVESGQCKNIPNRQYLYSLVDNLRKYKNYLFINIDNSGNNPMYNVKVNVIGKKILPDGKKLDDESLEFYIKLINNKEKVILPIFETNNNLQIININISKIIVEYCTGIYGLREHVTQIFEYNIDGKTIKENTNIEKVDTENKEDEYIFMDYSII